MRTELETEFLTVPKKGRAWGGRGYSPRDPMTPAPTAWLQNLAQCVSVWASEKQRFCTSRPPPPSSRGREWPSKTTQKGTDRVEMRAGTQLLDHRGNHISVKVASHVAERLSLAGGEGWVMVQTRGGVPISIGLFSWHRFRRLRAA